MSNDKRPRTNDYLCRYKISKLFSILVLMNLRHSISIIIISFSFTLLSKESKAEELLPALNTNIIHIQTSSAPDSGFFDKVAKGYKIVSNMSIEDLGEIASIVVLNKNKTVENITKDVSNYLNQLGTAKNEIKKIKINKNTRVYIKRS